MPNGKIKQLTDKGFGFIEIANGKDTFFHKSNVEGVAYESLQIGQAVSFSEAQSAKGPRAENVKPA